MPWCRRSWFSIDSCSLLFVDYHDFLGNIVDLFPITYSTVLNSGFFLLWDLLTIKTRQPSLLWYLSHILTIRNGSVPFFQWHLCEIERNSLGRNLNSARRFDFLRLYWSSNRTCTFYTNFVIWWIMRWTSFKKDTLLLVRNRFVTHIMCVTNRFLTNL